MDLALLREVTSQNPYRYPKKWPSVTENINMAIRLLRPDNPEIEERTFKEHMATLLKHHAEENTAQLKKQVQFVLIACLKQFMSKAMTVCWMFFWDTTAGFCKQVGHRRAIQRQGEAAARHSRSEEGC